MAILHQKPKGLTAEYAGIDLVERFDEFEFEVSEIGPMVDFSKIQGPYRRGPCTWFYKFKGGLCDIPSTGEVKIISLIDGPGDDMYIEGTAYIASSVIDTQTCTIEAVLKPVNAPVRFPAAEQRAKGIQTVKEQARAIHEETTQATLEKFRDVPGVWTIEGKRYNAPYSETHDTLMEAVGSAIAGIEWCQFVTTAILCDGVQVLGKADVSVLVGIVGEDGE